MGFKFFENFGLLQNKNQTIVNILARPKILDKVSTNPYAFYPYTVKEGERPDIIADKYYKNMDYSWLVYLSNQIIDPYYGWYLNQDQFESMLKTKYGSNHIANKKIISYRVNWDEDPSIITPATYDALPDSDKKYWKPIINSNNMILNYDRAKHDWNVTTNYYQKIKLSNTTNFSIGDLVSTALNEQTMSMAEVFSVNSSSIVIQHITGTPTRLISYSIISPGSLNIGESANVSNSTYSTTGTINLNSNTQIIMTINDTVPVGDVTIYGLTSNATVNISNAIYTEAILINDSKQINTAFTYTETIANCIPFDEMIYWSPWTAYEKEDEENTQKKHIRLLDSAYSTQAYLDLKKIMK